MSDRNDVAAPYESLAEIAQLVTASLDLSEVLEAVVRAATGLVPDSISRIWSLEEDRLVLTVERLDDGKVTQITTDGSENIINGTSDWVYEEEFGVRDGFRFSPDGKSIVYWQFDQSGVGIFSLINTTDSLYPVITKIPYPKAGTTNSSASLAACRAACDCLSANS